MSLEIVLMSGIPGCGKSTFQERFLPYHHRINLDLFYEAICPDKEQWHSSMVKLSKQMEDLTIENRLSRGKSLVIDNTNITPKVRKKYFAFAEKYGADIKAVYFEPNVDLAIKQNKKRERKVPPVAIYSMAKHYKKPTLEEGFSKVVDAYNPVGFVGENSAVFLDRDGVVNPTSHDGDYPRVNNVKDLTYFDHTIPALKELTKQGHDIIIVSNQAGVAEKWLKFSEKDLAEINEKIMNDMHSEGINLKGIYCCTHSKRGNCQCRKARSGLIIQAAQEHNIDPMKSYMVGDMTTDIEMGNRVYATTILVKTGYGGSDKKYRAKPDHRAKDLLTAAKIIGAKK